MKHLIKDDTHSITDTILFFDGAPYHQSNYCKSTIAKLGVKCMLNFPYSPELNPAEEAIRAHKMIVATQMRN